MNCTIEYISSVVIAAPETRVRVQPPLPKAPQYFPALTGLRFVLALWVVLHHLMGRGMMLEEWSHLLPTAADRLLEGGYLAVGTFFMLSGFVLAKTYAQTRWTRTNLTRFGVARFARIYPVYLLSLAMVARFAIEMLSRPGRTALQKVAIVGDYGFVLIGWMKPLGVGWNTPAWSLTCEIFFYLCFPLLFLLLRQASRTRLFAAFAISFLLPFLLARVGVPQTWKPLIHISDFTAGIAAAGLLRHIQIARSGKRISGAWLYMPALVAAIALIAFPLGNISMEMRPLNVLLLAGLAMGGGWIAKLLSTPVAEYLGKASYSIYILHVPLLWWYNRYAFQRMGSAPHTATTVVYLVLAIAVSIVSFELIEKPANRLLREKFGLWAKPASHAAR